MAERALMATGATCSLTALLVLSEFLIGGLSAWPLALDTTLAMACILLILALALRLSVPQGSTWRCQVARRVEAALQEQWESFEGQFRAHCASRER
jgi:hypothetical protein